MSEEMREETMRGCKHDGKREGMREESLEVRRSGVPAGNAEEGGAGRDFGGIGLEPDGLGNEASSSTGGAGGLGCLDGLGGDAAGVFSSRFGEALLAEIARETGIRVSPPSGALCLWEGADLTEGEAQWADPETDDEAQAAAQEAREAARRWAVAAKLALCLARDGAGSDADCGAAAPALASATTLASASSPAQGAAALSAPFAPKDPVYGAKARFYGAFLVALLRPEIRSCPELYRRYPEEVAPPFLAVQLLARGFARTEADSDSQGSVCTDFDSLKLSDSDLELVLEELENSGLAVAMGDALPLLLPPPPEDTPEALGTPDAPSKCASTQPDAQGDASGPAVYWGQTTDPRANPQRHPLVIDRGGRRIYFERRFADEMKLALAVERFAKRPEEPVGARSLSALAAFKVGDAKRGRTDADHDRAVEGAMKRRFTVITGGPGTGKTTVVVRILACLLAENPGLVIGGAAPTGKAASNLAGSIEGALRGMTEMGGELAGLAELVTRAKVRCQTLHRWLSGKSAADRPSAASPLALDVLVVDECSMMDIGLARQLFDVLSPARTRLILLGDKEQLAAVGPGSVFGELSDTKGALGPWICSFTKSHRFSESSRLFRLSKAVTPESGGEGDFAAVSAALSESQSMDGDAADNAVLWVRPGRKAQGAGAGSAEAGGLDNAFGVTPELKTWLVAEYAPLFEALKGRARGAAPLPQADSPGAEAFWRRVSQVGVLSSMHSGVNGTDAVNAFMEAKVREAAGAAPDAVHFPGRLILVTRNAWGLGLANGDTGIELPDARGELSAYFGARTGAIPVALLPEHESAFAITVHKSQGSSYHRLAVCLPEAAAGRTCSRELLYTAVTRLADVGGAKGAMALFASEAAVKEAVRRRVKRVGGLADRLSMLIAETPGARARRSLGAALKRGGAGRWLRARSGKA